MKILLIIVFFVGFNVMFLFLNTSFYAPGRIASGEPFELEVIKECFCIGELLELESFPVQYSCAGFNYCYK